MASSTSGQCALVAPHAGQVGFDASQFHQVVDESLQPVDFDADDAQEFSLRLLVFGLSVGQQLDVRLDARQRRLHLVADGRDELGVSFLQCALR